MDTLLSILIPTIPERQDSFLRMLDSIMDQAERWPGAVEILSDSRKKRRDGGPTIAEKRNDLYQKASGVFSVQIDDDDEVAPDYLDTILPIIERGNVDVIGHEIRVIHTNGKEELASVSTQYREWQHGIKGKYTYKQPPYYKVPIRTFLCQMCRMNEDKIWQEDVHFSQLLMRELKREIYIEKPLYTYRMPKNIVVNDRY